jgi:hypothetical protein
MHDANALMATESACTSEKITTPITVGEYWCFFVIKTHDTRGYAFEQEGIKICSCPRDSKVLVEDLMNLQQTGEKPYDHKTRLSYAIMSAACTIILVDRLNERRDSSENQKEDLKQWTDFYQTILTV